MNVTRPRAERARSPIVNTLNQSEAPTSRRGSLMSQEIQENALFEISETRRRIARFYERLMVVVFVATLAATCWLISSGPGVEAGHIPWRPGSILRAITGLMALDFQYPTLRGVEVKWLVQGLGAAFALMAGMAGWFLASRQAETDRAELSPTEITERNLAVTPDKLTPANVAQGALLLFAGWTILSGLWSPWPTAALGEGLRQLTLAIWAIALGRTLGRRAVGQAAASMAVVLAVTAGIGIWYFFERNPYQRLKFPIGNPIFMATCLLPGITLVIGGILGTVSRWWTGSELGAGVSTELARWGRVDWAKAAAAVVGLFALCWALKLTDSRGPADRPDRRPDRGGLCVGSRPAAAIPVVGHRRVCGGGHRVCGCPWLAGICRPAHGYGDAPWFRLDLRLPTLRGQSVARPGASQLRPPLPGDGQRRRPEFPPRLSRAAHGPCP